MRNHNGLVKFASATNELRLRTAGSPHFVHFKTRHLFLRFVFFEGKKPTLFPHHINHRRAGLQNINTKATQTGINVNQTAVHLEGQELLAFTNPLTLAVPV